MAGSIHIAPSLPEFVGVILFDRGTSPGFQIRRKRHPSCSTVLNKIKTDRTASVMAAPEGGSDERQ